jgi:hypothetical protein
MPPVTEGAGKLFAALLSWYNENGDSLMAKSKPNIKAILQRAGLNDPHDPYKDVDPGQPIVQEVREKPGDTLLDHQRLKLIEWIAEGLTSRQINQRAAKYVDPFHVGNEIVYYYRTYKGLEISAMRRLQESNAFNTGLALRAKRIERLNVVAEILYDHLVNDDGMWIEKLRSLGNNGTTLDVEFNADEVREFRAVLNDIATEVGDRVKRLDVTSGGQRIKGYASVTPDDWDEGTVVEGSTTQAPDTPLLDSGNGTQSPTNNAPDIHAVSRVDFVPLDPFAEDAPKGMTMFPRPKRSPKTTPERTEKTRKAAEASNKAQAKRRKKK